MEGMPDSSTLSLFTHVAGACPESPCPYCVLGVPHNATMQESADAYRNEYHRFIDTQENPWRYWMRSIAWNQLYVRHLTSEMPLQPGPWDEDTRGPDPPGGLYPKVPVGMVPNLPESWGSCCAARSPPPPPPIQSDSFASSSSAWLGQVAPEAEEMPLRWQYAGGKKRKWSDYEEEAMTQLEEAFQMGSHLVDLRLGEWDYRINFANMTQTSIETGTVRNVQRLCPSA
jgi:hypothetical protein